jgi:hypothetical protein
VRFQGKIPATEDVFPVFIEELGRLTSRDMKASKSAIVVTNRFRMAQGLLFLAEAKGLP